MPKHTIESDDSDSSSATNKRQRKSQDAVVTEKIHHLATELIEYIPSICEDIVENYHANEQYLTTVRNWKKACNLAKRTLPWTKEDLRLLDEQLPNATFHSYNAKYNLFSKFQRAKLFYLPSPSDFGKNWSQYVSAFEDRLLCFRPPNSRGLPLHILHHVFRQYCLDVQQSLPQASETAVAAMHAAKQLCASMGNSFYNSGGAQQARDYKEETRIHKFDDCLRGLLEDYDKSVVSRASCDLSSGIVDGALSVNGVLLSIREMKGEPGASGDPYMQVVRRYDLAVKAQRECDTPSAKAFVAQGAPMFLLCVSGPNLMVAGGFCDGPKVIVEPLGDTNIMFQDYTDKRRDKLAQVLYALATGIDWLKKSMNDNFPSPTTFPPFTPRIYGSCTPYDSSETARLVFTDRFVSPDSNRLLFTGSLSKSSSAEPISVLVKLVNGEYGKDVHHLLAKHDLAPMLLAHSAVKGAPTAYIMEYLDPSSWKPLSGVLPHPNATASIMLSTDKVIKILQKNGAVHGDLRPPNIMINVSPTAEIILVEDETKKMRAKIKVVDFDWAGASGQVFYPLSRNQDIAGVSWPGKPGGMINKDHDRKLFNSWWPNLVSAWSG